MSVVQATFDCGRIAGGQRVGRYIAGHYATGGNDTTVTDSHSRTHRDVSTQPAVFAYGNGVFIFFGFTPFEVIQRMLWGIKVAVGTYQRTVANAYISAIEKRAIEIDKHVFSYVQSVSVVALYRWTQGRRGRKSRYKFLYQCPVVGVVYAAGLQQAAEPACFSKTVLYFRVGVVGQLAVAHLLKFSHGCMVFCLRDKGSEIDAEWRFVWLGNMVLFVKYVVFERFSCWFLLKYMGDISFVYTCEKSRDKKLIKIGYSEFKTPQKTYSQVFSCSSFYTFALLYYRFGKGDVGAGCTWRYR